jgi:predicted nucleotidyltransferase
MNARPGRNTDAQVSMRVVEDPLNRETIQAITQLVVERFLPEQVILFGSVARGDEDENSDLDLLVVLPHNDEQGRDGYAIRLAIAQNFVLPVDILIRSADVLATYRQDPNSMLEDSEVLYDRRAA